MDKCSKCNGEMEKGVIADRTTDMSVKMQPQWGTVMGAFTLKDSHNVDTVVKIAVILKVMQSKR